MRNAASDRRSNVSVRWRKNGRAPRIRATPIGMSMKPADDKQAEDDLANTSARFRLKMTPDGQLVPEIVPVDEDSTQGEPSAQH